MSVLFQDELAILKDSARELVKRNPRLAKYFGDGTTDPDVEHLMEGFAFLTSKLREKIDDDFPEITHPLIDRVWPNFLRPTPPLVMMKFSALDKAITQVHKLPRWSPVHSSADADGIACTFRTTAEVKIYPLEIDGVRCERTRDRSMIEVGFGARSVSPVRALGLETLRLHFCGDQATRSALYLWFNRHLRSIMLRPRGGGTPASLPPNAIQQGSLGPEEALYPETKADLDGYRLLHEYYAFPEKFLCVDLTGLRAAVRQIEHTEFDIQFGFSRPLPPEIKPQIDSIRLHCCPAINLFEQLSGAIPQGIPGERHDIIAETEGSTKLDIFSVDAVTSSRGSASARPEQDYRKFDDLDHAVERSADRREVYWRHHRLGTIAGSIKHQLAFCAHDGQPAQPDGATIAKLRCFDAVRAAALRAGDICRSSQQTANYVAFANLAAPTPASYPPTDAGFGWRLISGLSLNSVSLNDPQAFASIIETYDYLAAANRQAERSMQARSKAIAGLVTKPSDWLVRGIPIRGIHSRMTLREDAFQGEGERYLFGLILSEFLRLYATINSFNRLDILSASHGENFGFTAKPGLQPLI